MKTTIKLIYLIFFGALLSCSNSPERKQSEVLETNDENVEPIETNKTIYDCEELPSSFSSYEEALIKIVNANFRYQDNISTTSSSWIRSAAYYSCDSVVGFFIIETDKQYFIHRDLPIGVWKSFKSSTSFGSFYSRHIKNNYGFSID